MNPAGVIERESPGRDEAVDMGMVQEILTPGVQDAHEADLGSQVAGV